MGSTKLIYKLISYSFIASFADASGSSFMCIQNGTKPELLIYAIETGKLEKKIKLSKERDQAMVGGFFGWFPWIFGNS